MSIYQPHDQVTILRSLCAASGMSHQGRGHRLMIGRFRTGGPRVLNHRRRVAKDDPGFRFVRKINDRKSI